MTLSKKMKSGFSKKNHIQFKTSVQKNTTYKTKVAKSILTLYKVYKLLRNNEQTPQLSIRNKLVDRSVRLALYPNTEPVYS